MVGYEYLRAQGVEESMAAQGTVYIGVRGNVLAINAATGAEIWRTQVPTADFVNVVLSGGRIFATTRGELHALDPASGRVLWSNQLKGLGMGLVTIAGSNQTPAVAAEERRNQAAADAAG